MRFRRRLRGQAVVEWLLSFVWLFACIVLILGVCDLWSARILSVHVAIEGACRDGVSPGSGVQYSNRFFNSVWPGQTVTSSVREEVMQTYLQIRFFNVVGNFSLPWLMNLDGSAYENSSSINAHTYCPNQQFVPRP